MANDRVDALRAQLESGVTALVGSDEWQAYLTMASKFHHYSFNNQLLIALQCPAATRVAGFKAWQGMGRQVRKGERSIGILAPMSRKVRDDVTGQEESRVIGFRVVSVFDVSQTDGEPLPEQPRPILLDGQAPTGLWNALASIVAGNGYRLERGACNGANGFTSPSEKLIRVRDDVSDAQAVKTLAHEIGHMTMHCDGDDLTITHRGIGEIEAESVAFIVANHYGIPTESYSFAYIGLWANGDMDKVRATAQRVSKTARSVIEAVDKAMAG